MHHALINPQMKARVLSAEGLAWLFVLLALLLWASPARAAHELLAQDLNEAIARLPVSVSLRDGRLATGDIAITTFKPAGEGPFPIAIVNHGRSTERSLPERYRLLGMASYLVRQGFAVFVPTRLGYGLSVARTANRAERPADPEYSGHCHNKNYAAAVEPAVQQIIATLNYARQQAYVDPSRHIVVGQSMGGLSTVAYAATHPPSLMAYVNFAGGVGGDPLEHPGVPCQAERLTQLYAKFGKSTRAPSLWLYTENDQFFAPRFSRKWHHVFAAGQSNSKFVLHPPLGSDGHALFAAGLAQWRPYMDGFLSGLGMRVQTPPPKPKASAYASIDELDKIPWLSKTAKTQHYRRFLAADKPRAFAISESGSWGQANGPEEPAALALAYCNRYAKTPCVIYAIDDTVVWAASPDLIEGASVTAPPPLTP